MVLEHFLNKLTVVLSTVWGWLLAIFLVIANDKLAHLYIHTVELRPHLTYKLEVIGGGTCCIKFVLKLGFLGGVAIC